MGFYSNQNFNDWFFSWDSILTVGLVLLVCYGIIKYTTGRRDDDREDRIRRKILEENALKIDDPSIYDDFTHHEANQPVQPNNPSREDVQGELKEEIMEKKIEEANKADMEAYMMEEKLTDDR